MGGKEEAEPIPARTLHQGNNFKGDQKEREIRKKGRSERKGDQKEREIRKENRDRVKEKRAKDICFYEYI